MLTFLIPSPNQKAGVGLFKEKWVLNPSIKSINQLDMLKFLGGLMGLAIRSKNYLDLNLPSIVWKQITQSTLDRKDLEYIDKCSINYLDEMTNIDKRNITDNETFNMAFDETFTTYLSNGD